MAYLIQPEQDFLLKLLYNTGAVLMKMSFRNSYHVTEYAESCMKASVIALNWISWLAVYWLFRLWKYREQFFQSWYSFVKFVNNDSYRIVHWSSFKGCSMSYKIFWQLVMMNWCYRFQYLWLDGNACTGLDKKSNPKFDSVLIIFLGVS